MKILHRQETLYEKPLFHTLGSNICFFQESKFIWPNFSTIFFLWIPLLSNPYHPYLSSSPFFLFFHFFIFNFLHFSTLQKFLCGKNLSFMHKIFLFFICQNPIPLSPLPLFSPLSLFINFYMFFMISFSYKPPIVRA